MIAATENTERDIHDPYAYELDEIDVSLNERFVQNTFWGFFERLRKEDPVHYCAESQFGPYWSVTRFDDIMKVDTSHGIYSSEGGITIANPQDNFTVSNFIAMDQPKHDLQRRVVNPAVGPVNLQAMEGLIRQRVETILDSLPIGETFNWVDKVSIELTTQMLATLFDFPFEDRAKLTRWSDVATAVPGAGVIDSLDQRREELLECLTYFTELWNQRINEPPRGDLISMLCHGESTRNMEPMEYLGNLILLIVGGNDTTRNSLTGGVLALNESPEEYDKLRADYSLIPNMVAEIIRWQTPLAHMRRTALEDTILNGKHIKKGDKVVMWYVSGNRDDSVIPDADKFIIDRTKARNHLSFGFGIHRCMGNKLAEMQIRITWEEIMKRFKNIEVVAEPIRNRSAFVKGYTELMVKLEAI